MSLKLFMSWKCTPQCSLLVVTALGYLLFFSLFVSWSICMFWSMCWRLSMHHLHHLTVLEPFSTAHKAKAGQSKHACFWPGKSTCLDSGPQLAAVDYQCWSWHRDLSFCEGIYRGALIWYCWAVLYLTPVSLYPTPVFIPLLYKLPLFKALVKKVKKRALLLTVTMPVVHYFASLAVN